MPNPPPKVVVIIQARMTSTRLPTKVLMDLCGEPMLARVVNRTRRAKVDEVVVATTVENADQPIVDLCSARGWAWARGSRDDVLDRYYHTARQYTADVVVRITSDCPLIEPALIDRLVGEYLRLGSGVDYVSNVVPDRTYPRGLDAEVFSFKLLEQVWREDRNPAWREHVTPFIYRNPERFRLHCIRNPMDHSGLRWTVDTPEDMALVRKIYQHFGHDHFHWEEVLDLLRDNPGWSDINREIEQKKVL